MHETRTVTVVVPVFNEAASIETLVSEVASAFADQPGWRHSVLIVDDGSTDETWSRVGESVQSNEGAVTALRLRRNFGKSDALAIGFQHCESDVVVTIDGDLQDDPAEIPQLLAKIEEGYDVVSGWKQDRRDPPSKKLPSRIFNFVTCRLSGVQLHDFNCGLKAYRAVVVQSLPLHGEMHRYIPVIAASLGFKIGEVVVNHRPRTYGSSKFGAERYLRGMLDLLTVLATTRYLKRPAHLFGGIGILIGTVGMLALIYLTGIWFLDVGAIGNRPLLFFGILCVLLSAQLLTLGILAELFLRNAPSRNSAAQVQESLGFESSFRVQ